MSINKTYWLVVIATFAVYVTMVVWSLPVISSDANDLMPFDMRPTGYTFAEAQAFLIALSADGTAFYQNIQHKLDMAFPLLEALSVGWGMFLLAPESWRGGRWLLAAAAVPGMIFDYLENANVAVILRAGAENLTREMVDLASFYTILKSTFVTISLVILLVMIFLWFVRRRKHGTSVK